MGDQEATRACAIGLLTADHYDNVESFIEEAIDSGHDFVATPIVHPRYSRVLKTKDNDSWRNVPVYERDDLVVRKPSWSDAIVGTLSNWLELDSSDANTRINSELALKQELAWACHLGLFAVMTPALSETSLSNLARVVNHNVGSMSVTQMWVRVLLDGSNKAWKQWNKFHALAEHNPKIYAALQLPKELPEDGLLLDTWFAEPIKTVIVPADVFISNNKGYPVLPKPHQAFLKKLMHRMQPQVIVTLPETKLHASATPSSYQEYIQYLNRNLPELNDVERFAAGYHDYLQAPLQPLMDNLDNSMYETFERDPIKYQQYEKAVYHALLDRVEHGSDYVSTIMVVGAGRGPLVNCCLRAAEKAERKVHLYALEKNPNAFVTLQNAKADVWHDKVTLVFADMRKWKPKTKCDILVSELLGSFGDNELSPECLDGAQKFLKEDGISIPASYTAYVTPLSSSKLYNEVAAYKDLVHFETPYVVMFQQVCELAPSKPVWTFEHPNKAIDDDPQNNLHNTRYSQAKFQLADQDMIMHGVAGYFESVLYKDVMISIHPDTHSPDMFSWFPIFFPLRTPVQVPRGSTVTLDFWRATDAKKVWYEWSADVVSADGSDVAISPIHNSGGRSYWVGL
ncbi:PRMT5 arginine-N-methyltransferase-domain-containing protein [Zychaea mexicana]|uniref:PRMT5 arginine-N-methyltransferase-domain-containing protein n=1 Tax=Zychaea mexicana TaxID=64656 RepID=UPI0022FDB0C5|nr:PRMT5 arginine-N-methyltransferase-domain-containing protein [Zychaea mexicana]KAI9495723.1 PRMT5 arginine-N-methyltransferase-domain-containing protein [Zychaea mexicana]